MPVLGKGAWLLLGVLIPGDSGSQVGGPRFPERLAIPQRLVLRPVGRIEPVGTPRDVLDQGNLHRGVVNEQNLTNHKNRSFRIDLVPCIVSAQECAPRSLG